VDLRRPDDAGRKRRERRRASDGSTSLFVAEAAIGITPLFYFPVPYEEMRLKE